MLDRAFADLHPEEAVIFLRGPDGEFARVAQRRLPGLGEEYGLARLLDLCRAQVQNGLPALAEALQTDLDAFANGVPFGDDRTFVLLRRLP